MKRHWGVSAVMVAAMGALATCQSSGGDGFFQTDSGGKSETVQQLVWFFGHPEVWVSIIIFGIMTIGIVGSLRDLWRVRDRVLFALSILALSVWIVAEVITVRRRFGAFQQGRPIETGGVELIAQLGSLVLFLIGVVIIARTIMRWLRGPIR